MTAFPTRKAWDGRRAPATFPVDHDVKQDVCAISRGVDEDYLEGAPAVEFGFFGMPGVQAAAMRVVLMDYGLVQANGVVSMTICKWAGATH